MYNEMVEKGQWAAKWNQLRKMKEPYQELELDKQSIKKGNTLRFQMLDTPQKGSVEN